MGRRFVDYYPELLPGGRAIMRRDVVWDDELVSTETVGSPAPAETVAAAAYTLPL